MAIDLDIAGDFDAIIDTAEAITLKRRASATTIAVPMAWRYSSLTQQAEPEVPGVAQCDVVWQFHWNDGVDAPRIGDVLIDASSDCWTILSIEQRGAKTRLRCSARNLRIVYELVDRIEKSSSDLGRQRLGPRNRRLADAAGRRASPRSATTDDD